MKITGKKLEMGQIFNKDGKVIPVTLIKLVEPKDLSVDLETPVKITGVSKGRGFSGVMKRHGFSGGPATHGQSDRKRAPGSIGGTTTPGRVYKGKKMAGRFGGKKVTVPNSKIMGFDKDKKILKVSGPVPGARNSEVVLIAKNEGENS